MAFQVENEGFQGAVAFFALALAFTWPLWTAAAFASPTDPKRGLFIFLGGAGPMLSAFFRTLLADGEEEERGLFHLENLWNFVIGSFTAVPVSLCVACLVIPLLIGVFGCEIHKIFRKNEISVWHYPRRPQDGKDSPYPEKFYPELPPIAIYFVLLLPQLFFLSFEEFGWRQYLLPTLLSSFPNLSQSFVAFVVGVLWALWHAPIFLPGPTPKNPAHPLAAETWDLLARRLVVYHLTLGLVSVVMTHLYQVGGGSIIPALLFHASFNSSFAIYKIERVSSTFESVLIPVVIVSFLLTFVIDINEFF